MHSRPLLYSSGYRESSRKFIIAQSGAAPLPAHSPQDSRGEEQQAYRRSGIAQEKVNIYFLDAEDCLDKKLELKINLTLIL